MSQNTPRTKNLQRIACLLLMAIMLIGLFPGSAFAANYARGISGQGIAPLSQTFTTTVGYVGPNNTFAPWGWRNDDMSTGVVEVGSGNVQGNVAVGFEASISPWDNWRLFINEIVFTDPVNTIGTFNLTSLFRNLPNLITIENIDYIDITATRWMEHMFRDAVALENIYGLENWNTSLVLRFSSMFRGTSFTTLDLSTFNMSSAQRFDSMFRNTPNLTEVIGLDDWNTSSVLWMSHMFRDALGFTSLDLSSWNTGNVTTFESMFEAASNLERVNLSAWNTSSATNFLRMFRDASSLDEITGIENLNTGSALTMAHMFRGANSLESLDLSAWNTSSVRTGEGFASVFRVMDSLRSLDLSGWNTITASAAQMADMFTGSSNLRELTLGQNWSVAPGANPNLTPSPIPRYTSRWTNVGTRTLALQSNLSLTPAQLMTGTTGANDTWVWEEAWFNVTFESGPNGTIDPDPAPAVTIRGGDTLAATDIPTATGNPLPAPGYKFAYWESATGSTYSSADLLNLPITANRIFTAVFVPSNAILVTFQLNGGLYGGDTNNVYRFVLPGDAITIAQVPTPIRPGWMFRGWIEEGTTDLLTRTEVGALIVEDAARTFVAQWTPIGGGVGPGPGPGHLERQAYLIGTTDGLIRPNANITRAEVATILFRLITDDARIAYWMQENPFSDVALQNWFNNAVSTMTNADVFKGFPDDTFAPNQTITRAEMTAVIVRFIEQLEGVNLLENHFSDIAGHWAVEYINTAAVSGWVQGYSDGTFRPNQAITRAETAAMINRISSRLQERTEDLLSNMITWPDNANENAWYYFYIQSATNSYTFRWRGANNAFEQWITIIPARDWTVLERPDSSPQDIILRLPSVRHR